MRRHSTKKIFEVLDTTQTVFSALGAVVVGVWVLSKTFVTVEDQEKAFADYDKRVSLQLQSLSQTTMEMKHTLERIDKRIDRVYEKKGTKKDGIVEFEVWDGTDRKGS